MNAPEPASSALTPRVPTSPATATQPQIRQFFKYIEAGVEAWVKAGKLLVELVDRNPNTYALLLREDPKFNIDLLLAFERIGRGEIYPQLLLEKSVGGQKLVSLPYELQVKYYQEPMEVVVGENAGKPVTVQKDVRELSRHEVNQVFGSGNLNTPEQQLAFFRRGVKPGHPRSSGEEAALETDSLGFYRISLDANSKPRLHFIGHAPKRKRVLQLLIHQDESGGESTGVFQINKNKTP